jgi:hypothetical protein
MSLEDASLTRSIMRDISKHQVDTSQLMVNVTHGVVYLRGKIKAIRGYENIDLDQEMHLIAKVLKQRSGIREVIADVQYTGLSALTRSNKPKKKFLE